MRRSASMSEWLGWGKLISQPQQKTCDLFWLWTGAMVIFKRSFWLAGGGRFPASEINKSKMGVTQTNEQSFSCVLHQHAQYSVPVEWKLIYHSNNHNSYNQVTWISHLNVNWGMLDLNSHSSPKHIYPRPWGKCRVIHVSRSFGLSVATVVLFPYYKEGNGGGYTES